MILPAEGIVFRETFAAVAKFTSTRMLLALAARHGLRVQRGDVNKAYLHSDLDEELYMRLFEGIHGTGYGGQSLKLERALYGLKQASCL